MYVGMCRHKHWNFNNARQSSVAEVHQLIKIEKDKAPKSNIPLIKNADKATQMSTFPFDYSSFLYIALEQYNVLLLVQNKTH